MRNELQKGQNLKASRDGEAAQRTAATTLKVVEEKSRR